MVHQPPSSSRASLQSQQAAGGRVPLWGEGSGPQSRHCRAVPCPVQRCGEPWGAAGSTVGPPRWLPALAVRSLQPRLHYVRVVARETSLLNWDQSGGGRTDFSLFFPFLFFSPLRASVMTLLEKRQPGMGQWEIWSLCNLVRSQLLVLSPC